MTLEQIEQLQTEVLTCKQIAPIIHANAYALHLQAQEDASKLGFPVIMHGNQVRIPRRAFINFMKGEPNGG